MRWLWSLKAIEVHAVFLTVIGLLTCALLTGDPIGPPGEQWRVGLFCALGYPAVPFLLWLKWRIDGRSEF
jgi:hypothetical protein